MKPEWRMIPGFSRYEASNLGDIRSHTVKYHGRLLKGCIGNHGYRFAILTDDQDRRKQMRFHTAVMLAFVGQRPKGMTICHRDGNRLNNRFDNLRYDTLQHNFDDRYFYDFGKYKLRTRQRANTLQKRILKNEIYKRLVGLAKTSQQSLKSLSDRFHLSYWQLSRYNSGKIE